MKTRHRAEQVVAKLRQPDIGLGQGVRDAYRGTALMRT